MGKIVQCTCNSEFQDKTYGAGKRYANSRWAKRVLVGFRCSVCTKLFPAGVEDIKQAKNDQKEKTVEKPEVKVVETKTKVKEQKKEKRNKK
jgi:hypothetical protein